MFFSLYVIGPAFSVRLLIDERHRSSAEVVIRRRGACNALPNHPGEAAADRAAVSGGRKSADLEADPADHVVLEVRALFVRDVVDGKEELVADPLRHRVLDLRRVELGAGIGEVPVDRHVAAVAVQDPAGEGPRTAAAVRVVEVQEPESPGPDLLEIQRRWDAVARR